MKNTPPIAEEEIFQVAIGLPAPERSGYLDAACGDDLALRARLARLLGSHDQNEFMQAPAESAALSPEVEAELARLKPEEDGEMIGPYKLREQVGEGGFGTVWVADQEAPVRRRVALKIIKLGMDTKEVIARFEQERQALAMMDHPNIAKVLDAGATQHGRPFFVMELVRGIPITDYCDHDNLPTLERIGLFIAVCQAVQHAHQKGIIHRDIKPSNILVTLHDGVPVPKVIDFGIAKATEGRLTDATIYTQLHQFVGTPAYMSPEQAEMSGLDIDTRSDIYSLGVLLYELLVGSTPFDAKELMKSGIEGMRKTIREKEPTRPSMKLATMKGHDLTTTAKRRSAETSKLIHQLQGDLDWIVMKCLEKDRQRRYDTANGLAADLKRHLDNEPVLARPPSTAYRFQKAFRRNRLAFIATAAVAGALIVGITVSTLQTLAALKAQRGEATQRQKAEQAQATENRLRRDAEVQELAMRHRAYTSDMNLAQQSIEVNNFGRAQELLDRYRTTGKSEIDLRGWEWRYLWQLCRSDAAFTLCRKPFEITSLTTSPDGSLLAVAEHDGGGLSIWDLRTRRELPHPDAGAGLVLACFSPRESLLAFSVVRAAGQGQSNAVRLWNAGTGEIVAEFPLGGAARGLKFSGDGRTLITSTYSDNRITLWRIPDGQKLASFEAPQCMDDDGTLLAVASDSSVAAHSTNDGRIRVIDLATGAERWTAPSGDRHTIALEFSPDGKTLASGGGFVDRSIRLWDVATGQEIAHLEGHTGYVFAFVFWPDGKTLASAGSDQTICLWNLVDPANVPPPHTLKGHRREVWRLALLPGSNTLVSGSEDGAVMLWHTKETQRETAHFILPENFNTGQAACRFAPDGKSILTVTGEGRVLRWQGPEFAEAQTWMQLNGALSGAQISEDCSRLATGSDDGTLRIWDLVNRKLLSEVATGAGKVLPFQFCAGGRHLLEYHPQTAKCTEWDLPTSQRARSLPGEYRHLDFAEISPDGRWFLVGAYAVTKYAFDLATNPPTRRILDADEAVYQLTFSPDGNSIAAASGRGNASLWETMTERKIATLRSFLHGVHGLRFSVDGRRLIAGSGGQEAVKLFDTASQQELLTLPAAGSEFFVHPPSPDNNIIAARSEQGITHVWRAPSFEEIAAAEATAKAEAR